MVDNLSNEQHRENLIKLIPEQDLYLNNENKGYAAGNNFAIRKILKQAPGHVVLLNPDIDVTLETLLSLQQRFEELENPAAVGTRICHHEDPQMIYSDGGLIDFENGFHTYHLNSKKSTLEVQEKVHEVDYVNGSVLMTHTDILQKVGLMREDFFMYFEETEWCLRARDQGYGLYTDSTLTALHTSSSKNDRYHFFMTRNRLWLAKSYSQFYPCTKSVIFNKIKNKLRKNLKKRSMPNSKEVAQIKGYIFGRFTNPS